jgi:hypothetical protein
MTEGWYGNDHLILFDEAEVAAASARYAISQFLPGYRVIGLRGWDDFIVQNATGGIYRVATVPVIPKYLSPYDLPPAGSSLSPDERFAGKIKWCVRPTVFGGDPELGKNVVWVNHEQHAKLVRWWNDLCRSLSHLTTGCQDQIAVPTVTRPASTGHPASRGRRGTHSAR